MFLKYNFILKTCMLMDIIAIDFPSKILEGNKFQLVYVMLSPLLNFRFFFKLFLNVENLVISLSKLYSSAN
jgi:NADH:ubiquinone oxidoreductase subunit C